MLRLMPRLKFSRSDNLFRTLLKDLRLEADLTQAQLAKKLGLPQSYVSKYETGERRLDFVETAEICETIGTDINDFARRFTERIGERNRKGS